MSDVRSRPPVDLPSVLDRAGTLREPYAARPSGEAARIPEVILHDVWVRGLFASEGLRTESGEAVTILDRGRLNHDSGPDIAEARVQIGDVIWAGDIEIHRTSGEWEAHGHQTDPAYDRVILHIILVPDGRTGTLRRADGSALPEVALLDALDRPLRALVREFYLCPGEAPHCRDHWDALPSGLARDHVRHLGLERLRARSRALGETYERLPDPETILCRSVFRALGYSANADVMEALARRVPRDLVRTLDALDVLALLLGLAGWLDAPDLFEARDHDLAGRFEVLRTAHALAPMNRSAWRRGGRPANAPSRRIAQAAALLAPGGLLRDEPIAQLTRALATSPTDALDLLRPPPADGSPRLGRGRAEAVLTNAVLPVLHLDAELSEREEPPAAATLDALSAEHDRVTRPFEALGLRPRTALESQGVHQLARAYCQPGRCAACAIGQQLFPGLRGH